LLKKAHDWFASRQWEVFPFQEQTWRAFLDGKSGIVNAPTGSGKTYALFFGSLFTSYNEKQAVKGPRIIWVSPIRALTKEIKISTERALEALGIDWRVDVRSGDTSSAQRKRQFQNPPEVLITTPESLHVILATRNYSKFYRNVDAIIFDEWHELMGSKRGVQCELRYQD